MMKEFTKPTPAFKCLVEQLVRTLRELKLNDIAPPRILNIGAGRKLSIEGRLTKAGCDYICDRIDIDDCTVNHSSVEKCMQCSVESMSPVASNIYDVVFANWVLEHVSDLHKTAKEIYRVLKPSSRFIATIPNITAPEFFIAKRTPLWFHKIIRGGEAWKTCYAYSSIRELIKIFELAGFGTIKVKYFPFLERYLASFPLIGFLGRLYDRIITALKIRILMGNVCIIFEKPSKKSV